MLKKRFLVSQLIHTWFIDIDGTIFKHNSYLSGNDILLPGVKSFWKKIPKKDKIVLLTARKKKYQKTTIKSLKINKLRFDQILFDMPNGERFLINDTKPLGLKTAHSLNLKRDKGLSGINFKVKKTL